MNTNDLGKAIDRVMADQQGYYLLGYTVPPDRALMDGTRTASTSASSALTPTCAGVKASSVLPAHVTPRRPTLDPLLKAALSPFATADISARLTSDFWHDGTTSSVRSMFFIDANDIAFAQTENGHRVATMDLGLFAIADNGQISAFSRKSISLDLTTDAVPGRAQPRPRVPQPPRRRSSRPLSSTGGDSRRHDTGAQDRARSFSKSRRSGRASWRCRVCSSRASLRRPPTPNRIL